MTYISQYTNLDITKLKTVWSVEGVTWGVGYRQLLQFIELLEVIRAYNYLIM